jgi:hypothetical protein
MTAHVTRVVGRDFHLRDKDVNVSNFERVPTLEGLARSLEWNRLTRCTCPYEWVSAGILYGHLYGKDWHRAASDPGCPDHREPS